MTLNVRSKPQLVRILDFIETINDVVQVLEFGQEKYSDDKNYLTYPVEDDISAALRHISKYKETDPETGKGHLIHAICRLLFASEKQNQNTEFSDPLTAVSTISSH